MLKRRIQSFRWAFRGISGLVRTQANFRIHLGAALATLLTGLWLGLPALEWLAILLCIGLVLTAEAFNSALEKLSDAAVPEPHPLVGMAKDMAAAAVLISSVLAAAVGLVVFLPRLLDLLRP
jgi:diacylglycerol kinase